MSSDDSSNAPVRGDSPADVSSSNRRHAVREKAQRVRAKQSRASRIRLVSLVTGAVAIVAIAAVVVTWTLTSASSQPQLQPANLTEDGFAVASIAGVAAATQSAPGGTVDDAAIPEAPAETTAPTPEPTTGSTGAAEPVDIRVYVDYLSSTSRDFQISNVQQLAEWVDDDAATLTYYPVAMLTAKSNGTKYSLRAAGAAACVATHASEAFFAFNNALLAQQPAVDSDGHSDAELADLAIASGADSPKLVRACIEEERFASWARDATDRALKGLPGTADATLTNTPTVLVNGTPYVGALDDPSEFAQFVLTMASDSYYQTPTPASTTPAATASPSPTS